MRRCPHCQGAIQDDTRVCPLCKNSVTGGFAPPPGALPPPAVPAMSPPVDNAFPSTAAQGETSGQAIASLICGAIGLMILPFIASVPAVILGHLSLSNIKKSAGGLKGQGLAIAGLVMGYLGVVALPFILIIAAIAIPNLLRARMAANEASAIGSLRTYNGAIVNYAAACPDIGVPASLSDLGPGRGNCHGANLVDPFLGGPHPSKSGYRFTYTPGAAEFNGRVMHYTLTADPISDATGSRHFFLDDTGVIRSSKGLTADEESTPIQ